MPASASSDVDLIHDDNNGSEQGEFEGRSYIVDQADEESGSSLQIADGAKEL